MHFVSSILLLSLLTVNVVSDAEPAPVLNCDPPDPPGLQNGYKVSLIRSGILNSIAKFCQFYQGRNIPDKGIEATHGPYGPKSKVEKNTQLITLRVKPVPGCSPWDDLVDFGFCQKAFSILTDGCDTSTMLGKRGGSVDYKCVRWEIAGPGGADVYRLHLSQRMVGDWSEVEWTMYDSRGMIVGGPSTDPHPTGAPYKLELWVDKPTDKDAANVHMRYPWAPDVPDKYQTPIYSGRSSSLELPQQVEFSTGTTGKGSGSERYSASYFCDDVVGSGLPGDSPRRWQSYPRGNGWGFHRDFDCYFRGWAEKDSATVYNMHFQDFYYSPEDMP